MHALGAQRIRRKNRHHRRIDATGKPQHRVGKTVLVEVVAQTHHQSGPGLFFGAQCWCDGRRARRTGCGDDSRNIDDRQRDGNQSIGDLDLDDLNIGSELR